MKKILFYLIISLVIVACKTSKQEEIKPLNSFTTFTNLIDEYAQNTLSKKNINSLAIAVYKDGNIYHNYYGEVDKGSNTPPNDSTLYEIASISKVFVGTLAAKAVLEGKIALEDDIRKHLDGDYQNLEFKGHPIRIKNLLTHTLGFKNKTPKDLSVVLKKSRAGYYQDRTIDYGMEDLLQELKLMDLDKKPGTFYEYNSVGPELIAYILEKIYQQPYRDILKELLVELKMNHTYLKDFDQHKKHLINSYRDGQLAPLDRNPLLGGAAGLITSLPDLAKFMKFQLESTQPVIKEATRSLFIDEDEDEELGYLWDLGTGKEEGFYYQKTGTSMGTQSGLLVCPGSNYGMILIMNNVSDAAFNDWVNLYNRIESDLIVYPKINLVSMLQTEFINNTQDAIQKYKALMSESGKYYTSPGRLNSLGYVLLGHKKIKDAIKVFELATAEYPENANLFDSLGEAYFMDENYEKALISYKKSLELNPSNKNAQAFIEKMK